MSKTKALHPAEESGTHAACIGNLRVVLVPDEKFWFAQGWRSTMRPREIPWKTRRRISRTA